MESAISQEYGRLKELRREKSPDSELKRREKRVEVLANWLDVLNQLKALEHTAPSEVKKELYHGLVRRITVLHGEITGISLKI